MKNVDTTWSAFSDNSKVNNWDPEVHLTYLLGVKQSGPLRMDVPGRKLGSMLRKWVISLIKWGILGLNNTAPITSDPSTSVPGNPSIHAPLTFFKNPSGVKAIDFLSPSFYKVGPKPNWFFGGPPCKASSQNSLHLSQWKTCWALFVGYIYLDVLGSWDPYTMVGWAPTWMS